MVGADAARHICLTIKYTISPSVMYTNIIQCFVCRPVYLVIILGARGPVSAQTVLRLLEERVGHYQVVIYTVIYEKLAVISHYFRLVLNVSMVRAKGILAYNTCFQVRALVAPWH